MPRIQSFIQDLKRRNVFRTAGVYAVVAFIVAQAADLLMPGLLLPEWTYRLVVVLLLLGFPVALVLSWAYDITPDGVRRTAEDAGQRDAAAGGATSEPAVGSRSGRGRGVGWAGVGVLVALVGFGGYAYLGPGSTPGSESGPAPGTAGVAGRHVIAVLPLTNMAGGEENEYFADGITEDILMNLGLVPDFAVISRTSVMRYKGTDKTVPEIARELGAGYVLEGSLRRIGDDVRVVVQLIEPGSDTPVWASSLTRRVEDVFEVQAEIARAVVDVLKVELSRVVGERIERAPTSDLAAYDEFLRARALERMRTPASLDSSATLLRRVVERDPDFAAAHAALALSYAVKHLNFGAGRAMLGAAEESARRAIDLAPDMHEGHLALATVALTAGRYAEAIPAFERSLELNPSSFGALNNLGLAYGLVGDWGRALDVTRRALLHDPVQDYVIRTNIANYYRIMEMYPQAIAELERSYAVQPGYWVTPYARAWIDILEDRPEDGVARLLRLAAEQDHPRVLGGASWALLLAGAEEEAGAMLESVMARMPELPGIFNPEPAVLMAHVAHRAGDADRALAIVASAEQRLRARMDAGDATPSFPYSMAGAAVIRGDHDHALEWLETAVERGWNHLAATRMDPLLAPLRGEPRFAAAVATMERRIAAMRDRVADQGL